MRRVVTAVVFAALIWPAHAAPVALLCSGTLALDGENIAINRETASIDLVARTFRPPFYPELPILIVRDNSITFGSEVPTLSTWGALDRVSGKLTLNALPPEDRKTLMNDGTVFFHALMDAQCVPGQRMF